MNTPPYDPSLEHLEGFPTRLDWRIQINDALIQSNAPTAAAADFIDLTSMEAKAVMRGVLDVTEAVEY